MGLSVIILANLFLVSVNSSNTEFVFQSLKRLAKDRVMWFSSLGTVVGLVIILYTPVAGILKLEALSITQFLTAAGIAAAAVFWYEIVKLINRIKVKK
jgi:Ca2+-transporting ATPase